MMGLANAGGLVLDQATKRIIANGGTGTITFGDADVSDVLPCLLNFDFELDMNSDPPSTTIWNAMGVPVEAVDCG